MKALLGVTGCIGAYKAAQVLRELQRRGVEVRVVMTRSATEFVRPLTFEALSGQPVIVEMFNRPNYATIEHIAVAREADLLLVAPATANVIAKFAHGAADDFLSTVYLSNTNPVLIAPAMNVEMWNHPATQANLEILRERGVLFVEPGVGYQACGEVGMGRLAEPAEIAERSLEILKSQIPNPKSQISNPKSQISNPKSQISNLKSQIPNPKSQISNPKSQISNLKSQISNLKSQISNLKSQISNPKSQDFAGEHVMVTAGPTVEDLDPVRFVTNRSSGKMGYAVAKAARDRGARVTLISGPVNLPQPEKVETVNVRSTREMFEAVMSRIHDTTVFIGSAAVADFRPASRAAQKIKKDGRKTIIIELEETEDIIAAVGADPNRGGRIVVGFAAESQSLLEYAERKLREKGLDLIVANDITRADAGFNAETNAATILKRDGSRVELPLQSKREMADRLLDEIVKLLGAPVSPPAGPALFGGEQAETPARPG